jgi:PhnB protein
MVQGSFKCSRTDLKISDCIIMLAEEHPDYNRSPDQLNGTSVILNLYVADVDGTVNLALQRGATLVFPVKDQFYGDRAGRIRDPFGHMWIISRHIKDVTSAEIKTAFDTVGENLSQ